MKKWLELNSSIKKEEWGSIIEYCEGQINRTYENMPVGWNFIIDSKLTVTFGVSIIDSVPKGLLLSIRKGRWTIYDDASVKNMFRSYLKCSNESRGLIAKKEAFAEEMKAKKNTYL